MIRYAALLVGVGVFGAATFYAADVIHRIRPHRLWKEPWSRPASTSVRLDVDRGDQEGGTFVVDLDE